MKFVFIISLFCSGAYFFSVFEFTRFYITRTGWAYLGWYGDFVGFTSSFIFWLSILAPLYVLVTVYLLINFDLSPYPYIQISLIVSSILSLVSFFGACMSFSI